MDIQAIFTQLKSIGIKFAKKSTRRACDWICNYLIRNYNDSFSNFFDDNGSVKNALTELFDRLKDRLIATI